MFDASKQSKRISANVSGFMRTTRISLNDNPLNRTNERETLAVLGHEMGHYVLDHPCGFHVHVAVRTDRVCPSQIGRLDPTEIFGGTWTCGR